MNREKLKALAVEVAKDAKSEADLNALSRELLKLTLETALNADPRTLFEYPLSIDKVLCPVIDATAIISIPFSNIRLVASLRKSYNRRSNKNAGRGVFPSRSQSMIYFLTALSFVACLAQNDTHPSLGSSPQISNLRIEIP